MASVHHCWWSLRLATMSSFHCPPAHDISLTLLFICPKSLSWFAAMRKTSLNPSLQRFS